MVNNKNGVSVIICCHNSSDKLPATLYHLAMQKMSLVVEWQLIVVDNNSTDDTKNVAVTEWSKYGLKNVNFLVCSEPNPGLTFARKKGVDEASYEYIIFCDDDNWLCEDYIETAYNRIRSDETYAAVGGQSEAVFDSNIVVPDWFEEHKSGFAIGEQAKFSGDVTSRGYLWGAGIIFRRSLFIEVYKYPPLLKDRKGQELSSGGDSEMCLRFILLGYKLYYDSSLKFYHYIPKSRLDLDYREALYKGLQQASGILKNYVDYIENYINNKKKNYLQFLWNLKYYLFKCKLLKIDPSSILFFKMVSIFTDNLNYLNPDLALVKRIYRENCKSNRLFQLASK